MVAKQFSYTPSGIHAGWNQDGKWVLIDFRSRWFGQTAKEFARIFLLRVSPLEFAIPINN